MDTPPRELSPPRFTMKYFVPGLIIVFTFLVLFVTFAASHLIPIPRTREELDNKHISCWQQQEDKTTGEVEYYESGRDFKLCNYFPDNQNQGFVVSGVQMDSDDYAPALALFDTNPTLRFICMTEVMFTNKRNEPVYGTRCICNGAGCNVPGNYEEFKMHNVKKPSRRLEPSS